MRFTGFIGPSYTLQSVNADCQRCVNLYPEVNEVGTEKEKEIAALVGSPGLKLLASIGLGPIRGVFYTSTDAFFVVSGSKLYSVDSLWNATAIGTLNSSIGPVTFADNGIQMVLVDGAYGYAWTLATSTFQQITDPNFLGADWVTFQDGYFIFNKPNTQEFYISAINGDTFDALDFGTAEALPDNVIGLISNQRNLYLFGDTSVEIYYDSGDVFPFTRVEGAFIPVGCAAKFSIARLQDAVYWLGKDDQGGGIVYRAQGYQPQRISTHALETVIRGLGDVSSSRAWTYQQGGHGFYCLNFPSASTTWVFDTQTNQWHERARLNQGILGRNVADCHAYAYSTNVVGDFRNGNIYSLDPGTYTDNGSVIPRIRTAPHISNEMKRVFYSSFQLDLEVGVGVDGGGQGTDPQAILQWSNDGGHTWSNEHWTSVGPIGETKRRAIWRRLGRGRDRVYRVMITDPVKVTLLGADLVFEQGAS